MNSDQVREKINTYTTVMKYRQSITQEFFGKEYEGGVARLRKMFELDKYIFAAQDQIQLSLKKANINLEEDKTEDQLINDLVVSFKLLSNQSRFATFCAHVAWMKSIMDTPDTEEATRKYNKIIKNKFKNPETGELKSMKPDDFSQCSNPYFNL